MSRLLMVESWVNATGLVLPAKIKSMGHQFSLLTRDPQLYLRHAPSAGGHPAVALADAVVEVETNDISSLVHKARDLHQREPFDGVLTTCDYYLTAAAEIAAELGLPGPCPDTMKVATKKHLVREACERAGLAGPEFYSVASVAEALEAVRKVGLPAVIKPVDLCSSERVSLIHQESEVEEAFVTVVGDGKNSRQQGRPGIALVESFIHGQEFCVETVTVAGHTQILGISGKTLSPPPRFLELGSHVPATLTAEDSAEVSRFVSSALAAIGYTHGLAHVEVRVGPNGPRLIEINPRMGGDYLFELYGYTSGIDIPGLLVTLALGCPLPARLGGRSRGSAALECLLPPKAGRVRRVDGVESLKKDPRIVRVTMKDVAGKTLRAPHDNSDFIGFVIAVDAEGGDAVRIAREAISKLHVVME